MTDISTLLHATADHAAAHLDGLDRAPVAATATVEQLRAALDRPLADRGLPAGQVVDELVSDVAGGVLGSAGGRFFGWVIGGAHPAALAADWLTAAWDQNAALYACGPAAAIAEEVAGRWVAELLDLPAEASFAFTTGGQMAHVTALAAARHALLAARGHDVEQRGLAGAPPLRVLVGAARHGSIDRAVRLLGLGSGALVPVTTDARGRIDATALGAALAEPHPGPTIVCLQAGEINTGSCDPFLAACSAAHAHGAWVHVDGAFGLWAATSPRLAHLTAGVRQADSWTTDAHKWLNVTFDCGIAIVRDADAHRAAMTLQADYLIAASGPDAPRDQIDFNVEWSRRARGLPVYAVIRALGREGIRELVERCCEHAARLSAEIAALPGAELLAEPELNQGVVRFRDPAGDHDRRTEAVIAAVQASGEAWFGPTTFGGVRAMRISVVNWRTSEADVDRAVAAVAEAIDATAS